MNLFISQFEDLIDKCNDVARRLTIDLARNSFIGPGFEYSPEIAGFCEFYIDIEPSFYDANIIVNNILNDYVNEYSKSNFYDVYINGIINPLNEVFYIKMGVPCINLQEPYVKEKTLLSHWESILLGFIEAKNRTTDLQDWVYSKGCDIIYKYYNQIKNEQNKSNHTIQDKQELALLVSEMYENNNEIEDYVAYILTNSFYLFKFDCKPQIEYNETDKSIVIEYYLPRLNDTPNCILQKGKSKQLSQSAHNKLYDDLIYKITIRSLAEIFHFDSLNKIETIFFNGRIKSKSEATGRDVDNCILSIQVKRDDFEQIDLNYIDAKACFKHLKGVSASKIYDLVPIVPILSINKEDKRFVDSYNVDVCEGTNLASMDWEDFEHLVRELFDMEFNNNGGEVKITQSSRDGGVDAIAFDPDPLRGGKIVIQAKRYTNTVGVSAVRDLYGTVINEGANKGILITTSDYGSDSYNFAKGKPITLLNGGHLLYLMEKHGKKAYINIDEAKKLIRNNI